MGDNDSYNCPNKDEIDEEREIYFIMLQECEKKLRNSDIFYDEDINYIIEPPQLIYNTLIVGKGGLFLGENVFKLKINILKLHTLKKKKSSYIKLKFILKDNYEYSYNIEFPLKQNSFIYDSSSCFKHFSICSMPRIIYQNIIPFYESCELYIKALEKNNKHNKIELLFKETIELYKKKKKFSLLIYLFLKIYDKYKHLCCELIDSFKQINEKGNTYRDKYLYIYLETINNIYSNANNIINTYSYESISFYAILFCYLNIYDKDNFPQIIKQFSSESNADILYEILIIYVSHFIYPLKQDINFYNNFFRYIINKKKELNDLNKMLLYIDDLKIYLNVINMNIDDILNKKDEIKFRPLELGFNFFIGKEKRNIKENEGTSNYMINIINSILIIIKCSFDNRVLLIYFKSSFWNYLIKYYYENPSFYNIENLICLRYTFKKYNELINNLFKDINRDNLIDIKMDINKYYEKDEFAFALNKNIKGYFEKQKGKLTNIEILRIIENYNPYFNIKEQAYNEIFKKIITETYIFDYINFHSITKEFEIIFHHLNFEELFKENIEYFINKITSKIEDITTFRNIFKLIDINRIIENQRYYYYDIFKEKFKKINKTEIELLEGNELNETVKIFCKFIMQVFSDKKSNILLENIINELNDKIKISIYNELVKIDKDKKFSNLLSQFF